MQVMQDNLRSAVYRSLTKTVPICSEDCNGTIESRTRTKPKTSSFAGMELRRDEEEEKATAHEDYTTLQLFQVSRGAQKLSQMIEFWSKTASIHDSRSQGFVQDLLKGALDLQESLLVLKNLRDASNLSTKMNLIMDPEPDTIKRCYSEEETFKQDLGSKFYDSISYSNRWQDPYLSPHVSPVNCVEELKQTKKKDYMPKLMFSSDDVEKVPSSRSLRFTMSNRFDGNYFDQFAVKEDLICSGDQPCKANATTLVAKLMGLEEVPSKKIQHHKRDERNISLRAAAKLDIRTPKTRMMQTRELNFGLGQKSTTEIIEEIQIKGLMERNQINIEGFQPPIADTMRQKQFQRASYKDNKAAPIVIRKPTHSPTRDGEINKKVSSYNTYAKEEIALDKVLRQEKDSNIRTTSSYTTQQKEIERRHTAIAESFSAKKTLAKTQHMQQKEKGIKTQVKLLKQQMSAKCAETKGNERKIIKNTQASIHLSNSESKPGRHDKVLYPGKTDASSQARTLEDQLKCAYKPIRKVPTNSTNQMNSSRAKSIRRSTAIKKKSHEEIKCIDGNKVVPNSETSGASLLRNNSLSDQPFKQIGQYCKPYSEVREYKESMANNIDQIVGCDVMAKASQHRSSSSLLENALQIAQTSSIIGKIADMEDDITYTLLTCQSFFSSAKEHFGLHPSKSFYSQSNTNRDQVRTQNAKLLSDLAEELMARRSQWHKHRFSPFLQTYRPPRRTIDISLDKLVQEISRAIKKLACYSTGRANERRLDILYIRLEKDLQCEDITMNSIWDIGWLNGVCLQAAEEVIEEIGDYILSRLINEQVIELVSLGGSTDPFSMCNN